MKTILNIILIALVLVIWTDLDRNIENPELHYSNTIISLAGLLFFGFFRVNANEFLEYLKGKE